MGVIVLGDACKNMPRYLLVPFNPGQFGTARTEVVSAGDLAALWLPLLAGSVVLDAVAVSDAFFGEPSRMVRAETSDVRNDRILPASFCDSWASGCASASVSPTPSHPAASTQCDLRQQQRSARVSVEATSPLAAKASSGCKEGP